MVKLAARPRLTLLALAALVALVGGCGPLASPVDVEAVVRDIERNELELGVVTLETATNLFLGESTLFSFRRDVSISKTELGGLDDASAYPTVLDFVEQQQTNAGGRAPDVNIHEESGVWKADDYDTLFLLSAWVGLERALLFFREMGDDSGATTRPLLVAQYGRVHAFGIPEGGADNAAYLDRVDVMIFDPVFLLGQISGGLPLAMSDGVVAHELGHRLFFYRVFIGVAEDAFRRQESEDVDVELVHMSRGFNEAVADVMAIGMTRDPNFGRFVNLGDDRDVEGDFARSLSWEGLRDGSDDEGCGDSEPDFGAQGFNPYCIATLFARTLWEASGEDATVHTGVIVPALVRALPRFGANIQRATDDAGRFAMAPEHLLEPLVDEIADADVRASLCAAYGLRFQSVLLSGNVPSCP